MTYELIKKLDKRKKYSWDEVMDIATSIATWTLVEFVTNTEVRTAVMYAMYDIKPVDKTTRKKQKRN